MTEGRYIDDETLKRGLQLTDECSRLIQSFAGKVKGSSQAGLQFKQLPTIDPLKAILREHSPETFDQLYGDQE